MLFYLDPEYRSEDAVFDVAMPVIKGESDGENPSQSIARRRMHSGAVGSS